MKSDQLLAQEKSTYARVEAPCPYFGTCGGCNLQDLAYEDQLALKQVRLRRALEPLGDVPPFELIGLEPPWRYRNKAEFTFAETDGRLVLGYHAARSFWRLIDLDDCLLLPEPVMALLREVRLLAADSGLPAYHPRTHQGFFRHLLVRSSHATGQMLLCLITSPGSSSQIEPMARSLTAHHPLLSSVYWGSTNRLSDVALPDELVLLHGTPYLEERVGAFRVLLHPLSFLQPTVVQAERIYDRLCQRLQPLAHRVAWDLYCGLGLVAFYLAGSFQQIYGIDAEPHSIALAVRNAALNGVQNVDFRTGKVETLLRDRRFWLQEAKPDVIVVDPPRAGVHPQALASILAARPARLAYLSCNVQSLVRDLQVLSKSFPRYRLCELQAFDMFPQTHHVELLGLLQRQ